MENDIHVQCMSKRSSIGFWAPSLQRQTDNSVNVTLTYPHLKSPICRCCLLRILSNSSDGFLTSTFHLQRMSWPFMGGMRMTVSPPIYVWSSVHMHDFLHIKCCLVVSIVPLLNSLPLSPPLPTSLNLSVFHCFLPSSLPPSIPPFLLSLLYLLQVYFVVIP